MGVRALLLLLLLVACAHSADPRAPVPLQFAGQVPALDLDRLEQRIHIEVNAVRQNHGLRPLAWDGDLAHIARAYSVRLRRAGRLTHTLGGSTLARRYKRGGYRCERPIRGGTVLGGGENLAQMAQVRRVVQRGREAPQPRQVQGSAVLARATVQGWMNSPPHRKNLLMPQWRVEGIGLVIGRDHRLWITQNFC